MTEWEKHKYQSRRLYTGIWKIQSEKWRQWVKEIESEIKICWRSNMESLKIVQKIGKYRFRKAKEKTKK